MPNEFEFDAPQMEMEQQEQPPVQDPEPQPEPQPPLEPQPDPNEDRLRGIEDYLSRVNEFLQQIQEQQSQQQQPTVQQSPAMQPQRQRPNFGDNTVAQLLWDRIEELSGEIKRPWEEQQKAEAENRRLEVAYAALQDDASRYIDEKVRSGEPRVSVEQLSRTLAQMGMIRDRRVPIRTALDYAYGALAYQSARDQARQQGINEVTRNPAARVPVGMNPPQPYQRPQMRQPMQPHGPVPTPKNRLEAEMQKLDAALGKVSPDDLASALGGL